MKPSPCYYCNHQHPAVSLIEFEGRTDAQVTCTGCGATSSRESSVYNAIEAWNEVATARRRYEMLNAMGSIREKPRG